MIQRVFLKLVIKHEGWDKGQIYKETSNIKLQNFYICYDHIYMFEYLLKNGEKQLNKFDKLIAPKIKHKIFYLFKKYKNLKGVMIKIDEFHCGNKNYYNYDELYFIKK